jgi:predicted phage baseplate assembly protein
MRTQIPRQAQEWTDHNVHDPGITFLELFAWLAENQIYYLNQVPATHEVKFLRLLGFTPQPATPAQASVTFALTNPLNSVLLPKGTQVAAQQPGSNDLIVFETDVPLQVMPLAVTQVLTSDRTGMRDNTQANDQEDSFYLAFGEGAEQGSSLYVGLEFLTSPPGEFSVASPPQVPQLTLMVSLYEKDLPARGTHGDEWIENSHAVPEPGAQQDEPLPFFPSASVVWEYWNGTQWTTQWPDSTPVLHQDNTCALSWSGHLTFNLPPDLARRKILPLGNDLYWLRCRVMQAGYEIPPRFESLRPNTIPLTQGATIVGERHSLGQQLPQQVVQLAHSPILVGSQSIQVLEADGQWQEWQEVPDFDASGPDDAHYVLNRVTGAVLFGDGMHGRMPPAGANNIRAVIYRYGGGTPGNVGADMLRILLDDSLQESLTASNRQPATGGTAEEELSDTRRRALLDLRVPYQAVTSSDYEYLARATPALRVARAKALPLVEPPGFTARNGLVTVAVVPFGLSPKPLPSAGFVRTVCEHLNRHRLITTEVRVIPPDYVQVAVAATVLLTPRVSALVVRENIVAALQKFLDPLRGGVAGAGWEFGRSVYQSEIYQVIESVSGVDCVMRVGFAAQGNFQFEGNNIRLTRPHGLVYSGEHQLELIDPAQRCDITGHSHVSNVPKKPR